MIISYENGKMIITHDTGVVCVYTENDLLNHKSIIERHIVALNNKLIDVNTKIAFVKSIIKP